MRNFKKKNWITWNHSMRSRTISAALGLPLYSFEYDKNGFLRHLLSLVWTAVLLLKKQPDIIFIQYSYLLLVVLAIYKILARPFRKVTIVCDCHTKALKRTLTGPFGFLFTIIKKWCFTISDCSIISHAGLEPCIRQLSPKYFILPDILPTLDVYISEKADKPYFVYSNSFAVDEPYRLIVEAAGVLENGGVTIYWTNRPPRWFSPPKIIPKNIIFTGYLTNDQYFTLLAKSNGVIALTTEEDCLQCAAYEGVALEIPVLVSNTRALREYFGIAAIYVEHNLLSISTALQALANSDIYYQYRDNANKLKPILRAQTEKKVQELQKRYLGI